MVLKFGVGGRLVLVCGMILLCSLVVGSAALAQSGTAAEAPFIGFRPFGSGQSVSDNASVSAAGSASRVVSVQAQSERQPAINPGQPASAYPYPASGSPNFGAVSSSRSGTVERASLDGRLSSTTTSTGSLGSATNSAIGQVAGVGQSSAVGGVDPALWQRYQQELQQQQAQQQAQQYQQWLAQQQQYRSQRQTSSVGFRSPQTSANGQVNSANNRVAQPTPAARPNTANTRTARTTTGRLNQVVVQQVSSTTTSNRDRSVARADFSSSVAGGNSSATGSASTTSSTSVAKQATSVASSVAKPQCCCVPQNCCAAPARAAVPTTPAPVFRPLAVNRSAGLAANQVPSLGPNVGSTFGGFLGQAGANYQVQPQGGGQFQSGLGVPQFGSTGAFGGRSWFSNGLFGTGAYTPLLPLANAQGAKLGQGIIGQPTAYMDGQPIRNLLRYISP